MILSNKQKKKKKKKKLIMKVIVFRIVITFYLQIYNTFVIIFHILFDSMICICKGVDLPSRCAVDSLSSSYQDPFLTMLVFFAFGYEFQVVMY